MRPIVNLVAAALLLALVTVAFGQWWFTLGIAAVTLPIALWAALS